MNKTNCFYLALLVCSTLSCSKSAKPKDSDVVPEVVTNMITSEHACVCLPTIDQYLFRDKYIYVLRTGGPLCQAIDNVIYYNSKGETTLGRNAGYTYEQFLQEATHLKNLLTCPVYNATDSTTK